MVLAPEHQKIQISNLQKISKKYLDVADCIYYDHVIFQHEIPCCVGSAKKTNLVKFWKKFILALFVLPDLFFFCFFCRGHSTKYFELKRCTMVVHVVVYSQVFLLNFF
jgi:hypothetical protein